MPSCSPHLLCGCFFSVHPSAANLIAETKRDYADYQKRNPNDKNLVCNLEIICPDLKASNSTPSAADLANLTFHNLKKIN